MLNEILRKKCLSSNKFGIGYKDETYKKVVGTKKQKELRKITSCWECVRTRHTQKTYKILTCYKCNKVEHKPGSCISQNFWRKKTGEDGPIVHSQSNVSNQENYMI